MYRLPSDEEQKLFLEKCFKEKKTPTKELFELWKAKVESRNKWFETEEFKAFERERIRRQQRTIDQTIAEDGAVISPIDEKPYYTKQQWLDHQKINDVIEVGNETRAKKKNN